MKLLRVGMKQKIKSISEYKPIIYNSDIREIENSKKQSLTPDEAELLLHKGMSESRIQQACRQIFLSKFYGKAKFIQIDNGNTFFDTGESKEERKFNRQKMIRKFAINRKRKKAEGTEEGRKAVMLVGKRKIAFVEFKKVGAPSEIEPDLEQKEIHKFLLECGFPAYFCNNTVYFKKVICEDFID